MNYKHLTDAEIQEYALAYQKNVETPDHLRTCEACQAKLSSYVLLFSVLKEEEPARFDFDLAGIVMEQLAVPVKRSGSAWVFLVITSIIGLSLPIAFLFMYAGTLASMFVGLGPVILPLACTAALTTVILLGIDMYKNYRKKLLMFEIS